MSTEDILTWSDEELHMETLLLAVEKANKEAIEITLTEGAKINKRIESTCCLEMAALHTATLHWVAPGKHVEIVEFLISRGANVHTRIRDIDAQPIHCVADFGVFNILPHHKTWMTLCQEIFDDAVSILEILLKNRASVHARDYYGRTPLHYAAAVEEFQPEVVRYLLDHGADVNAKTKKGRTPIMYARNENILRLLIERGADVNHVSRKFFTALSRAIRLKKPAWVNLLLEAGADVHLENSEGETVLETTKKWHPEILEATLNKVKDFSCVVYNFNNIEDQQNMLHIVVKRIVHEGLPISSKYFHPNTWPKYTRCEKELEKMKNTKINNMNFSIFDILVMPINNLMNYVEKEEIAKLYDSLEYDFPLYADMLRRHIELALDRRYLIGESAETFKAMIFTSLKIKLPDLVVFEMIPFLHNLDLFNLAEVKTYL